MRINLSKHISGNINIHFLENSAITIIILSFIELLSEELHDFLKWPMALIGTISIICCLLKYNIARKKVFIIIITGTIVVLEQLFSEGIVLNQYIWDICICFSVALCIFSTQNLNVRKWIILYIAVTFFLLVKYVQSPDGYYVFYNRSRNYLSVFQISLIFLVSYVANKKGSSIPAWMIYTSTVMSIAAVGRGGVISSLVIFSLYVLIKLRYEDVHYKKTLKTIALMIIVFIGAFIFIIYQNYIIEHFFPRFGSGNGAANSEHAVSVRLTMWSLYIKECFTSFKAFLLGVDPFLITVRANYVKDFNLHNSYLILHAFYGIIGVVSFILCMFNFMKRKWNDNAWTTKIICVGFIIRSLTDYCFPGTFSGIIFWIIILVGSDRKNKSINSSNSVITKVLMNKIDVI